MLDDFGRHPELRNNFEFYEMTGQEQKLEMWRRLRFLYEHPELGKKYFKDGDSFDYTVSWNNYWKNALPVGISLSMFQLTVLNMANDEQRKRWADKIKNLDIIGCYAQTELGHGSNIAGIETTATFDKATDSIIINSPTLTSTKFWPGDLGHHATHAVVFARLIVDDNDYGIQPFMV